MKGRRPFHGFRPGDPGPFGNWIRAEGPSHADLPEFLEPRQVHADFHRLAAGIVHKANIGRSATEGVALGNGSEYNQTSLRIVQALMSMKRHLG